jgi:hypothetical protein
VTLSNTGGAPLNITSIAATSPFVADVNPNTNGSTCGSTLAANSSCLIAVTFGPHGGLSKRNAHCRG